VNDQTGAEGTQPHRLTTDVLIVGAGPVGMITALLLDQVGLQSLVVEKHTGLHSAPQAHVISSRSMEICRLVGIDEKHMRELGTNPRDMHSVRWVKNLTQGDLGVFSLTGDDAAMQAMFSQSPTPICNLSQHLFEPILYERVCSAKGATVQFACEWLSCQPTSTESDVGYVSRIQPLQDSCVEVCSRYIIGADGAASAVRAALNIPLQGPAQLAKFCNVHFRANLRQTLAERNSLLYWVMDPEFAGVFIAHDIENTWVYMKLLDTKTQSAEEFDRATCSRLLSGAIGQEIEFSIEHINLWTMTAQVAEQFGKNGIFLVGDAAHRFPPTGGIGMNTGFQDAHNIAWKLALVEKGFDASLLSTYDAERRPVAEVNSHQSMVNHLKMAEVAAAIGLSSDLEASRRAIDATIDDAQRQASVQTAIDAQYEHFNMRGLDLGFCYTGSAIINDGQPPEADNTVSQYLPSTTPGARLPHAWLIRDGVQQSTLDLIDYNSFTLLHHPGNASVREAIDSLIADNYPVCALAIGPNGDAKPIDATFDALFNLANQPLLIRPDGHIAWRAQHPQDVSQLHCVLRQIVPRVSRQIVPRIT